MQQIAPYFGYIASLLLAISLMVSNNLKFRWLNLFGTIFFIIYGIFVNALPVLLTNAILFCINAFYLFRIYRQKEDFELVEFKGEEKLVQKFLSFYQKDIAGYFPSFQAAQLDGNINFVVLRDLVIANLFSARLWADGTAEVVINFTPKQYRDFKNGTFIFDKEKRSLAAKGVKRILYTTVSNKRHEHFLKVTGFSKEPNGHYTKAINNA